ncbi:MAG: ROK family protein, partial [Spirochaetes bacterium]|nr:ROK family protein [Spirochaetota bacterium]
PLLQKYCSGVGIAVPGDIDEQTGILRSYVLMPQLNGTNFYDLLKELFPSMRIFIEHNIRGMISYFLLDRELIEQHRTILYISARSATACGIIHRGIVVTAHGEFGHIHVSDDGKRCICGRTGCLDNYFSFNGFMEFLQSPEAHRAGIVDGKLVLSLDVLAQAYREGNTVVCKEMDMRLSHFARALVDVINLVVPDVVILSGELLQIYGDPIEALNRVIECEFHDTGYVSHYRRAKLIYRELGADIAALGICRQMIEEDWGYLPPDECE